MKFVINTNYKAAGTVILDGVVRRLKERGESVIQNDWRNYENFDVAIFMAPDSDVRKAKKNNPKILTIIFDPKVTTRHQRKESRAADFLIVSSIEQRDFFLKYNKNIFIYYMFPDVPASEKVHADSGRVIIGYHGNKQHLDGMADVSWALDEIAKSHDIELRAIYNIKKLGTWRQNHPSVCPVTHVQWEEGKFLEDLKNCDIGIAPSALPTPKLLARPFKSFFRNLVNYVKNDYVLRFKMSNNPGRLYVFSQLGLPVVTDFTPSACQMITDGKSGALVGTREGWRAALEALIASADKRNEYARNLRSHIAENYSVEKNYNSLISWLENFYGNK